MTLPAAPPVVEPHTEWGRLDPRMIVVKPLNELIGLLPLLFALVFLGNVATWRVVVSVGTVVLIVAYGLFAWLTTKYRITETQVELHSGMVFRQRKAIPRDRIRTVDLTAKLGHRLFGLSAVRVGTGQRERGPGEGVVLDAVSTAEADRLRQEFLRKTRPTEAVAAEPPVEELSRLDRAWYRYAPLTLSGLIGIGVVLGFGMNLAGELDLEFSDIAVVRTLFGWITSLPVAAVAVIGAGAVLVLSTLMSLLSYLLAYHGYRLTRSPDGTLRTLRGLLTTRSVSVEEQRLRGVSLHEPLLLRTGGGARLNSVTTGLGVSQSSGGILLPPAPRAEADRVAAVVLQLPETPTSTTLNRHPAAARTRRYTRALIPPGVVAAGLFAADRLWSWPGWLWVAALVLVVLSVPVAADRYRSLGHALTSRYLVSRTGSLNRRTVALQRTGIIGWTFGQSLFQRRVGLMTLTAVTAAGSGSYAIPDVGQETAVRLADEAVPGLLRPFLVASPSTSDGGA